MIRSISPARQLKLRSLVVRPRRRRKDSAFFSQCRPICLVFGLLVNLLELAVQAVPERREKIVPRPDPVTIDHRPLWIVIRARQGIAAIEYGLIAALVSVAAIGVLTALGTSLAGVYDLVTTTLGG